MFVRTSFLIGCTCLFIGCSPENGSDSSGEEEAAPLDYRTSGTYTASTFDDEFTGSSDIDLKVQVWAPSKSESEGAAYRYGGIVEGDAYLGLPFSCESPRPVVVFSHGNGGLGWQSPFFAEHLASHGYIVAAPDHSFKTAFDSDPDKFVDVVFRRPLDVSDTFDWLSAQSNDPHSALAGCVDADDGFAVVGHSFGGYTTYAVAGATVNLPEGGTDNLGDDRVWAALAWAPWDVVGTLTEGMADISVPVMTLSGTLDESTPWSMVSALHDYMDSESAILGEFHSAGHYSFAPVACQIYQNDDGCGDGFIDQDSFLPLVNSAGLSFLEDSRGVDGALGQLPVESEMLSYHE